MFTRNFWKFQAAYMLGKEEEICGSKTVQPNWITVDGTTGKPVYVSSYEYHGYNNYMTLSDFRKALAYPTFADVSVNRTGATSGSSLISSYGVLFGSGNEPATIDDVKLSGESVLNCTCSYSEDNSYENDGSNGTVRYTYTITNNNDTEVTIGEIGIFTEWYAETAYNSFSNFFVMQERTALETPITIPAGGVGQVTYTIKMEYPVPPIEE